MTEPQGFPGADYEGGGTGGQIDNYFFSVRLFWMPGGGIRYEADAADTANDEYEGLRCVADRNFDTERAATVAGATHIWTIVRAHQGLPDDSHTWLTDFEP